VISAEQAMVLVRERGNAMARAAAERSTSMTAVIGGDRAEVLARLEQLGLTAANDNGPGQVVAAGTVQQLAELAADPPKRARLIPLQVAGAFHTEHMQPAVDVLARHARAISVHDARTPLISNRDGHVVHEGRQVLARLVSQVAQPVRWDMCMATMRDLGVTGLLEMPPAGTLTGIAKRGLPGVETFALSSPDQLDDARLFLARHADGSPGSSPMDASPTWRLLVSPAKGTFTTAGTADAGDDLVAGHEVGAVASLRDQISVKAPHGGRIMEWLVEDGDLVSPGQPLLRLHPVGEDA
jgi:[acyl-carrier-protein] S-malonyltransferase